MVRWAGWRRVLTGGGRSALDLLLPPSCNFCGQELPRPGRQPLLCEACVAAFRSRYGPACPRCAAPTNAALDGDDCPRCRDRRYHFESAGAVGIYRDKLREAVIRMKQLGHEPLIVAMGMLLAEHLRDWVATALPDLIAPIPAHWLKRLVRGLNGPDLLADAAGQVWRIPVAVDLLVCRRRTRKQGTLLPAERAANVRDAFRLGAGYDIRGVHVLLVDDILTTGATASEAAKTLRQAGAARVRIALVARGAGLATR